MPNIYIIDDDPMFQTITQQMIHFLHPSAVLHPFEQADVALQNIQSALKENKKLLIFLDIHMPNMSGWAFLSALSEIHFSANQQVHLYMVSSSTDQEDMLRAKQYPILLDFLHKPLTLDRLQPILAAYLPCS